MEMSEHAKEVVKQILLDNLEVCVCADNGYVEVEILFDGETIDVDRSVY